MIDDGFRLFPQQASTLAPEVDRIFLFLIGLSAFFTLLIASLIVYFAIKFRRNSKANRAAVKSGHQWVIETLWIGGPFLLTMVIYVWGASLYFTMLRPPAGTIDVDVVGRRWMWKFQHPEGNSEINELHVPLGRAVRLKMISEDVIHAMYVPAFRVKHDVLPGRFSELWFEASQLGEYHLFCAEYCGAKHSEMIGRVVVMEPSQYQAWLSGGTAGEPPAEAGRKLFEQMRCGSCHQGAAVVGRGPPLDNLFGSEVKLTSGQTVIADDNYLRESILRPASQVVAGFQPLMPAFEGQLSETAVMQLIAYLKSLSKQDAKPENSDAQPEKPNARQDKPDAQQDKPDVKQEKPERTDAQP